MGHWHCSYPWSELKGTNEFTENAIWDIYEDDKIICIDRCTAYTGKVNILVLDDTELILNKGKQILKKHIKAFKELAK